MANTVVAFGDLPSDSTAIAGGKGASLSRMAAAGLPVPPGFVVAASAFRDFLESCGGRVLIATLTNDLDVDDTPAVEAVARAIHDLIMRTPLPPSLAQSILAAHAALEGGELVAVRSSAVSEDGETASFAGQQESYLNVRGGDNVLRRVKECWASFFSPRALFYRAQKAVLADTRMAVVVQEMVHADKSGVMFTVDPIRNRYDCMVIEGAPGLGAAIVSGEVTPDHYVISRDTGALVDMFIPDDEPGPALSDSELKGLWELGLRLEAFFGSPQDVEWCIRGDALSLLQARPITTLNAKTGSPLIQLGRLWVIDNYPYNSTHLLQSLDWVDRLAADASEAVRLATLTHDMERAFGGPDSIPIKLNDRAYEEAHSNRSARIVSEWLRHHGAGTDLVRDVDALIRVHEWGGSPDANLVQAADSLSFLETNVELMVGFAETGKYSKAEIAFKFDRMYDRIQLPEARSLARPLWEHAKARLGYDPRVIAASMPLYLRPASLAELLSLMREHGPAARLLAGGTDLLVRLRKGSALPPILIDLKRVSELRADITEHDGYIRIGARVVMTDVIEHKRLRELFPALIEAASVVGSVQIRNRATLAGNLCNASPAADTAPPLLAYGATVNLARADGSRRVLLDDFFTGPGRTVLEPGEIVEAIDLPLPIEHGGSAFGRLTRRHGVDLAIVSVCCVAYASGKVRWAVGAVGPRPFVVTASQDASLDDVVKYASPISDLRAAADYRRAMLAVIARRTLIAATARLRESQSET